LALPAEEVESENSKKPWDITPKERAIFSIIVMTGAFMALIKRFGAKSIFIFGVLLFTVASLFCGMAFAPALGPTIGGFLTEYYSWRMVFLINVPVGLLLIVSGFVFLPKERMFQKLRFNFVSFVLISFATVSLLIMLSKGQQLGWLNDSFIGLLLLCSIIGFPSRTE